MKWAIAIAVCTAASIAHGEVYKCTDGGGRTAYADTPCSAGSRPLALPNAEKGSATDPNMCAQLRDELDRLAADAQRNAERGRKEGATGAARRQALNRQYAKRCMGIARSDPKPG